MTDHHNKLCECPLAGFCSRHGIKKNARQHQICRGESCTPETTAKYWNAWERGEMDGQSAPVESPTLFKEGHIQKSASVSLPGRPAVDPTRRHIGGAGTELKALLAWFGQYPSSGCGCVKYAAIMDAKGLDWCESNMPTIIDWLVIEAKARSVTNIFAGRRTDVVLDDLHAEGITEQEADRLLAELSDENGQQKQASTGNMPVFRFAARQMLRAAIANAKKKLAQPQVWQIVDRKKFPPLIGKPIDKSQLKEHILYHVMPLSGDTEWVWRRHLDWLRDVRPRFNGRMIIGIVTHGRGDHYQYCHPSEVKTALAGLDAEFIEAPNDVQPGHRRGIGEGVLFPKMLERLRTSDPNQVFFYGHCKGVTRPGPVDSVPNRWAEAMFDTLFRAKDDATCLLDHFGACGPFLMRGGFRPGLPGLGPWYFFSGTFFAMRLVDVFNRDWRERLAKFRYYGCVEQFPRLLFQIDSEAACLFMDDTQNLYDESYWEAIVQPELEGWRQCTKNSKISAIA